MIPTLGSQSPRQTTVIREAGQCPSMTQQLEETVGGLFESLSQAESSNTGGVGTSSPKGVWGVKQLEAVFIFKKRSENSSL